MINYLKGDATSPIGVGNKYICHICNDIGAWGAGFVLAISKKWKTPELAYKQDIKNRINSSLGDYSIVTVAPDINVVNIIGQHGVGYNYNSGPPIRYEAVKKALANLAIKLSKDPTASVHMPRIGCGLAGGKWSIIESIILDTLCRNSVPVYVYDLG